MTQEERIIELEKNTKFLRETIIKISNIMEKCQKNLLKIIIDYIN